MAAGGDLHVLGGGNLVGGRQDDFKFLAVGKCHHVAVKLAGTACGVGLEDVVTDRFRSAEVEFPATAAPDEELHETLDIEQGLRIDGGTDDGFKP